VQSLERQPSPLLAIEHLVDDGHASATELALKHVSAANGCAREWRCGTSRVLDRVAFAQSHSSILTEHVGWLISPTFYVHSREQRVGGLIQLDTKGATHARCQRKPD
jgi:hypothetical protein